MFSKESIADGVTLLNKDAETLLRSIKEFMQITSDEAAQQAAEEERYNFNTPVNLLFSVSVHAGGQSQKLILCLN